MSTSNYNLDTEWRHTGPQGPTIVSARIRHGGTVKVSFRDSQLDLCRGLGSRGRRSRGSPQESPPTRGPRGPDRWHNNLRGVSRTPSRTQPRRPVLMEVTGRDTPPHTEDPFFSAVDVSRRERGRGEQGKTPGSRTRPVVSH